MKTTTFFALSVVLCAACSQGSDGTQTNPSASASRPAQASAADRPADPVGPSADQGVGTWEGTGESHDVSGRDLGAFKITLTRVADGPDKVRSDGKVTLADGRQITFWQETERKDSTGFRLTSSRGSGGGRCFSNGMCTMYEARDTQAVATTIVKDAGGALRVLVTELDNGAAVRFHAQTLLKKQ